MERVSAIGNHLLSGTSKKVCLIFGMGPGISKSTALIFGENGYVVVMVRRNGEKLQDDVEELNTIYSSSNFIGIQGDARKEEEVKRIFKLVNDEYGIPDIVVYNIGANVPCYVEDETSRKFMKIWEMASFSGFLVGKEAISYMIPRGSGTIIFTGASASLRGRAGFSAFTSAKSGLRAFAQSLAKEVSSKGIHVCHVVIDGTVNNPQTREYFGNMLSNLTEKDFIDPNEVGKAYFYLHNQKPSAWTFEMDMRTNTEPW